MLLSGSGASMGNIIFQLVVVLIIFVVVLILTYYTTKWIAGYQKTHVLHNNLRVIETMKISGNKYLQIVEVGKEQYFVIGLGKDEVTLIGQVSKDQLNEFRSEQPDSSHRGGSFEQFLTAFKKNAGRTDAGKKS